MLLVALLLSLASAAATVHSIRSSADVVVSSTVQEDRDW
jgi:hypothetical protein